MENDSKVDGHRSALLHAALAVALGTVVDGLQYSRQVATIFVIGLNTGYTLDVPTSNIPCEITGAKFAV